MLLNAIESTAASSSGLTITAGREAGQVSRSRLVDTEDLNPTSAYGALLPYRFTCIITLSLIIDSAARLQLKPPEPSFLIVVLIGSCSLSFYSFDKEQLIFENLFYSYRKSVVKFTLKTNFV